MIIEHRKLTKLLIKEDDLKRIGSGQIIDADRVQFESIIIEQKPQQAIIIAREVNDD